MAQKTRVVKSKIAITPESVVIEAVTPVVNGGRYPIKRGVGDVITVEADIFKEGHEPLTANLIYREKGEQRWQRSPMELIDNDRWRGSFTVVKNTRYEYTIEGYPSQQPEVNTLFRPLLEVVVDRPLARCAAWYEMWPRSQGTREGVSATFADMTKRLPEIRQLGFDVIYLTPIHPVGRTNRKGKNNSLEAGPAEPGSPYAVGNEHGGYFAVEPSLGTLEEFDDFVAAGEALGMEVALDIALNCSPDHPYVASHPDWFYREADGTIKYAENPPKKYEDIYPLNFFSADWENLWIEMKKMFLFWREHGVKIFRVDNPHTKPIVFWEWLIAEIKALHPEVIFLAEAFTVPKMMKVLAKVGFSQSYTYFTWRNEKQEFTEYLQELTQSDMKEYYRGNFFTNTPDILPLHLQEGGPAAFKMRLALAATLSSIYGIYNGFELCEGTPLTPGKEDYLDSEKYQFKVWDWDRPGNIKSYIARVNAIRKAHPSLQQYENLRFYRCENEKILFYGKQTEDKSDLVFIAVNLDYRATNEFTLHLPLAEWGIQEWQTFPVKELLTDSSFHQRGGRLRWRLGPEGEMAAIFHLSK